MSPKYCISPFEEFMRGLEEGGVLMEWLYNMDFVDDTPENRQLAYDEFKRNLRKDNMLCERPEHQHVM